MVPKKTDNQRRHPRVSMTLKVNLTLSESGEIYAVTRDISEGGIFLLLDEEQIPQIGKQVNVQVQGLPGEEAPWVKMTVVRTETAGVGLRIVEEDSGDEPA